MMLGDLPRSTEWNVLLQNGCNLPMGLEPRVSPQLTMVNRGFVIAQAEYHSSQVVSHGNAHSINPVVVHFPDHFLSCFILLLLFFLHLWTMVILHIFSWHLLLLIWLNSWLSFFWVHLLRILLIIRHHDEVRGGYWCRLHHDLFIRVSVMEVVVLFLRSILVGSTGVRSLQTVNHL
jgi:hypothetical protein